MGSQAGWFYRRPVLATALITLGLTAGFTALLWWAGSAKWSWVPWLISWLACVNCVTLLTYAYDKRQAEKARWRVPEATLFLLALVGGSPGAFLAMRWFRHKSIKGSFRVMFWLIVASQAVLLAWIAKTQWID